MYNQSATVHVVCHIGFLLEANIVVLTAMAVYMLFLSFLTHAFVTWYIQVGSSLIKEFALIFWAEIYICITSGTYCT